MKVDKKVGLVEKKVEQMEMMLVSQRELTMVNELVVLMAQQWGMHSVGMTAG